MRRRDFLMLAAGATAARPLAARAQQVARLPVILFLWNVPDGDPTEPPRFALFDAALRKLGWISGTNVRVDVRYDAGDPQRYAAYAADIAAMPPAVIVAVSYPIAASVAATTRTVPIIQLGGTDPVSQGLVSNLARPDGNLTAFPGFVSTLAEKWFEILTDMVPATRTVGYLYNPSVIPPIYPGYLGSIQGPAKARGVALVEYPVESDAAINAAVAELAARDHPALLIQPDNFMLAHRAHIIGAAIAARLPTVTGYEPFANEGGLASYAANTADLYVRAANYADALLRGEKIANLPIQSPAVLDLVLNLDTAKTIGITLPAEVLVRATRLIQ